MERSFSSCTVWFLLGLSLLAVSPSWAGDLYPPLVHLRASPSPAMGFQPVRAVLLWDMCGRWTPENDVNVQVDGTTITLTHEVVPEVCIGLPPPPMDVAFDIGAFPPGNYTLVYAPTSSWGAVYAPQTTSLVVLSPSVAVPGSSITALGFLFAAVLIFALRVGMRRMH